MSCSSITKIFRPKFARFAQNNPAEGIHFFSGYDCDSLALEPVTGFAEAFLSFFETLPNAWLELRTKSTQIRSLSNRKPLPRCIVAFSLSPAEISAKVEDKAPSLERRLAAIVQLQKQGWLIGLRFDPLIYQTGYQRQYQTLFEQVFAVIDLEQLHSVSLGVFRLPESYYKKIHKLYPDERLFASPLQHQDGMVSYQQGLEQEMMRYCSELLLNYIPADKFFPCST